MRLWQMINQDREWDDRPRYAPGEEQRRREARHRHLERIHGRSLSPFSPDM
jgi:hypothetical protein